MMRPMKLAGSELMFGKDCLEYIKTIKCKKASIVIGGSSMVKSGILDKVRGLFAEIGAETQVVSGVEPDPSFATVMRGANEMKEFGNASIARHKVPRYFIFVNEFPMNAAGKILKYKMREEAVEKLGIKKTEGIVTQ